MTSPLQSVAFGTARTVINEGTGTYDAFPDVVWSRVGQKWVCTFRGDTSKHLDENADWMIRTSTDDAWTSPTAETQIVTGAVDEDCNGGAGIMECRSGRLVFVYTVADLVGGSTVHTPDTTWSKYSDDGGDTWSTPTHIALQSRGGNDGWTGLDVALGKPVQLADGTLLVALYGRDSGDSLYSVKIYRSTDDAVSWSYLSTINGEPPADGLSYAEPILCLLSTGRILCMIRNVNPDTQIYSCYSDDDGDTWSTPAFAFTGTGKPSTIEHNGLVLCSYRAAGADKWLPALRVSTDGGATWSAERTYFTSVWNYLYAGWAKRNGRLYLAISLGVTATKGANLSIETDTDIYFCAVTVKRQILGASGAPLLLGGGKFLGKW